MPDNPSAYEQGARAQFVEFLRKAGGPYMAALLEQVAVSKGLSWEELAGELGCSLDALNRIACCRAPEPENLEAGLDFIAGSIGVDAGRLHSTMKPDEAEYDVAAETRGLYTVGPVGNEPLPGAPERTELVDDG